MDKIRNAYEQIRDKERSKITLSESFLIDLLDSISGISDEDLVENFIEDTIQFLRKSPIALMESGTFNPAGVDWKQHHESDAEAEGTDHSYSDASDYIKANYPHTKTYNVNRVDTGFSTRSSNKKIYDHTDAVDHVVSSMGLKKNDLVSGSVSISPSLRYGWHAHENRDSGHAMLYYTDGGMGSDSVTIAGKTKAHLNDAVEKFRSAGVIPDLSDIRAKREENNNRRKAILDKKGITVGAKIGYTNDDGSTIYHEIHSILPSGKIKVKMPSGEIFTTSPGSISNQSIKLGKSYKEEK